MSTIPAAAYLIYRHKMDGIVDGVFLKISSMDCCELQVLVFNIVGVCLRISVADTLSVSPLLSHAI